MNEHTLLISLAEDNHTMIKHHMLNEEGITTRDLTNCIGHILATCTKAERFSIIQELGLCWFANEFETLANGFPISKE